MELLKSSPKDCYLVVQETTVTVISKLRGSSTTDTRRRAGT